MNKLQDVGGRILLGAFGLAISAGFFSLMAYFVLWIEPHNHFAFLAQPNTSPEAWRLSIGFGLVMAGSALVGAFVSTLYGRMKKHTPFC